MGGTGRPLILSMFLAILVLYLSNTQSNTCLRFEVPYPHRLLLLKPCHLMPVHEEGGQRNGVELVKFIPKGHAET